MFCGFPEAKNNNKQNRLFPGLFPCLLSSWPWMYFPFSFPGQSAEGKSFQITFLRLFCMYTRCHKRKLSFLQTLQKTLKQWFTSSELCSSLQPKKWSRCNMYALTVNIVMTAVLPWINGTTTYFPVLRGILCLFQSCRCLLHSAGCVLSHYLSFIDLAVITVYIAAQCRRLACRYV